MAGGALGLALIGVLGATPMAVLIVQLLSVVVVFNHANVAIPQSLDRLLRLLVVTPDMHRIHHSSDGLAGNRNFANVFPWWDRLFSTYLHEPAGGQIRMPLGLADLRSPNELTLVRLLMLPFRAPRAPQAPGRSSDHAPPFTRSVSEQSI